MSELENERDEARAEVERWRDQQCAEREWNSLQDVIDQVYSINQRLGNRFLRIRDGARRACQRLREQRDELRKERDEARRQLNAATRHMSDALRNEARRVGVLEGTLRRIRSLSVCTTPETAAEIQRIATEAIGDGYDKSAELAVRDAAADECLSLAILIHEEPSINGYVSHCLNYDLVSQGRTKLEALAAIADAISVLATDAISRREMTSLDERPAPKELWERWRKASRTLSWSELLARAIGSLPAEMVPAQVPESTMRAMLSDSDSELNRST